MQVKQFVHPDRIISMFMITLDLDALVNLISLTAIILINITASLSY